MTHAITGWQCSSSLRKDITVFENRIISIPVPKHSTSWNASAMTLVTLDLPGTISISRWTYLNDIQSRMQRLCLSPIVQNVCLKPILDFENDTHGVVFRVDMNIISQRVWRIWRSPASIYMINNVIITSLLMDNRNLLVLPPSEMQHDRRACWGTKAEEVIGMKPLFHCSWCLLR